MADINSRKKSTLEAGGERAVKVAKARRRRRRHKRLARLVRQNVKAALTGGKPKRRGKGLKRRRLGRKRAAGRGKRLSRRVGRLEKIVAASVQDAEPAA